MKRTRVTPTMNPVATCAECGMEACYREETSTDFPILKCHRCIVAKINELHASTIVKLNDRHDRSFTWLSNASSRLLKTLREDIKKQEDKIQFLGLSFDCGNVQENDPYKCDIKIVVQGHTLYAHTYVLCKRSPVFERMFENDLSKKLNSVILIDDATPSVMRAVINSFYNAKIVFDLEVTPEEVLNVAHKYDICYLQRVCEETIVTI